MGKLLKKLVGSISKKMKSSIVKKFGGVFLCIILCVVIFVASGLAAVWSFVTGLVGSIFGDFFQKKQVNLSNYTLEKLIECADDEDIITDEYLRNMMIDRDSYKRLLMAVNEYNTTYKTVTKKIQCKHTYTTYTTVQTGTAIHTVPSRHEEYVWKDMEVSTEDLEGAYKVYWQPVFVSTLENFIYNYNSLILELEADKADDYGTDSESEDEIRNNTVSSDSSISSVDILIEYAKQFLGKPYTEGGTSLNDGCDAFGYILQVFGHFGYIMPQPGEMGEYRTYGDYVCDSYVNDVMYHGDIVLYSNEDGIGIKHAGIYIGNGKIISSMKEKGVCISSIDEPGTILEVRRVWGSEQVKSMESANEEELGILEGKSEASGMVGSCEAEIMPLSEAYNCAKSIVKLANKSGNTSTKETAEKKKKSPFDGMDEKLSGKDNQAKIWNFLKAKGLSDVVASAIMGNIQQESNYNPLCGKNSGRTYYGICQWGENSNTNRWTQLKLKYPGHEWELLYQLKFMWLELTNGGGRSKTLPLITHTDHLDYKSASDPGAVWIFAYYYEGCVCSDEKQHKIQEYDKRLSYAIQILKTFGGKNGPVTEGKIYNAGDTSYSSEYNGVVYGEPAKIGTFNVRDKTVHLSDADIQTIINDFKPDFDYAYDFVRDKKASFTFNECKSMENSGLQNNGGDPSTAEGLLEWYLPTSSLSAVFLDYADITYSGNQPVAYQMNYIRWRNIMSRYVRYYADSMFVDLLEMLPHGEDPITMYKYYLALSDGKTASSDFSSNGSISNADGVYEAMDKVKPSIKIPENAGGMSIPLYLQTDKRWSSQSFGGGNIGTSGCSVTSLAMVLSYLKNKCIYPPDIVAWTGNRYYVGDAGQSWAIMGVVAKHWGLKYTQKTVNAQEIRTALKAGKPVIVSASGNGTTQEFTRKGHYIVLRGLSSSGKVLVNDPNDSTIKAHYLKAYTPEFIVSECTSYGVKKAMWIFSK